MKKIEQAVRHNKSQRIIHLPPNHQGKKALDAFVNLKVSKQLKQLALNLDAVQEHIEKGQKSIQTLMQFEKTSFLRK